MSRLGDPCQNPDREATHEVDGEGAVGKGGERESALHETSEHVAGESSQKTPGTDHRRVGERQLQVYIHSTRSAGT